MEHILDLYAKPYNPREPVLCFDEKSVQLLEDTRPTIPVQEKKTRKRDYEYKRNGTANIFVAVEPQKGFRTTKTTKRRTRTDFAHEIARVTSFPRYQDTDRIHIVLDNLNTHYEKSITETYERQKAAAIMKRIRFHYTPTHASWLNMAEIEIGILSRQCLRQRIPTQQELRAHTRAWREQRNRSRMKIKWRWTKQDARRVFKYSRQN
jgi:transposase